MFTVLSIAVSIAWTTVEDCRGVKAFGLDHVNEKSTHDVL